jgi:two-component system OmpR family response regulator
VAVTDLDVPVVSWPSEAGRRDDLAQQGRARLLVVEGRHDPPQTWDALEDWVRAGVDPVEVYVRRERLRRQQAQRAPAVLDEDGLLRRGDRWVAVSRAGDPVSRAELLAAVLPGAVTDDRRALDRIVRRVRVRVAPLGMTVQVVRGFGFVLETGLLPD